MFSFLMEMHLVIMVLLARKKCDGRNCKLMREIVNATMADRSTGRTLGRLPGDVNGRHYERRYTYVVQRTREWVLLGHQ